jgi:thymidylate synthase (FAD)
MRSTHPQVHLIAGTEIYPMQMHDYLADVGGEGWMSQVPSTATGGEMLIEFAGRMCYRSWAPGLNANVTKVRTDSADYLENILRSGHGSVLEHASYTFVFQDCSRVATHEIVRHRAGVAISQESLRYVRLTDLGFRVPEVLNPLAKSVVTIVEQLEEFQQTAAKYFGLDDDGVPFHYKKEVTSALRRLAPIGLSTTMVWTANVRALRHVLEMRTALGAEEEMRIIFDQVGRIMQQEAPMLFSDFEVNEEGEWKTPFSKV